MKRDYQLTDEAMLDLIRLQKVNPRLFLKAMELIREASDTPFAGRGKPEPLKGNWSGYCSRRIDDEHRIIYQVRGEIVYVKHCFGHYGDK